VESDYPYICPNLISERVVENRLCYMNRNLKRAAAENDYRKNKKFHNEV